VLVLSRDHARGPGVIHSARTIDSSCSAGLVAAAADCDGGGDGGRVGTGVDERTVKQGHHGTTTGLKTGPSRSRTCTDLS